LYALRSILESYVAHEFTRHASDETVSQLAATVKRLKIASLKKSRSDVLSAKKDFYAVLFAGAGNSLVREILGGLMSRVSLLRGTSLMRTDRLPKSIKEISTLLECIQNRDAKAAQEVSRRHVLNAELAALDVLEKQISDLNKPQPERKKAA
jgi:DNA-binding GntR family transcriptional regulator